MATAGFSKFAGILSAALSQHHLSKNFPLFVVIHRVKGFPVINEAEVDVFFLEFSCFHQDPMNVGNLISNSSAFPK